MEFVNDDGVGCHTPSSAADGVALEAIPGSPSTALKKRNINVALTQLADNEGLDLIAILVELMR